MNNGVRIDTVQDSSRREMSFRITIDMDLDLYETFDIDLQQALSDAINNRNKIKYMEVLTELVRRLEKTNG